jgi:hypothetical protein
MDGPAPYSRLAASCCARRNVDRVFRTGPDTSLPVEHQGADEDLGVFLKAIALPVAAIMDRSYTPGTSARFMDARRYASTSARPEALTRARDRARFVAEDI